MRSLTLSSAPFRALRYNLSDFAADYLEKLPQLPSYTPVAHGHQTKRLFGRDILRKGSALLAFDSFWGRLIYCSTGAHMSIPKAADERLRANPNLKTKR